jgi:phosphatidate cytidylyltransferase
MNLKKEKDASGKQSKLQLRVKSAILLIAVLALALSGNFTNFYSFVFIISIAAFYEWDNIFYKKLTFTGLLNMSILPLYSLEFEHFFIRNFLTDNSLPQLILLIPLIPFILNTVIMLFRKEKKSFLYLIGSFYIGSPMLAVLLMFNTTAKNLPYLGILSLLALILLNAVSDTAAYFIGTKFKGPKIAPKISPKKSWSGSIGAMLATGLALASIEIYRGDYQYVPHRMFLGALLSIVSQLGDLFESWIKRRNDVKDASNLIPGHGGVLDRIDSLLFVIILASILMFAM